MSTDELERLLGAALHQADSPVDVPGGRTRLARRLDRERLVRRWTVVGVAAAVLAVVVTTSLVVSGLRHDQESLPVSPPKIALSPSGLPVGLLVGKVDRTEANVTSTVRMVVRADGTGIWNAGTVGGDAGPSVADYDVEFVREGPGRALMRLPADPGCFTREDLTLEFTLRGRTVLIEDTFADGCLVSRGLADDLPGTTLRIRPLPQEPSADPS